MFELHTKDLTEKVTLKNLPTLRQTFVVGSTFIIVGVTLGLLVHKAFFVLPLLVAGGLMVSGLFGICPMVLFLQKMPRNRK